MVQVLDKNLQENFLFILKKLNFYYHSFPPFLSCLKTRSSEALIETKVNKYFIINAIQLEVIHGYYDKHIHIDFCS